MILTRREEINRVEKEEPDPSYLRVAHVCVRVACKHAVHYSSPYSPLTKRAIEEARVIVVFSVVMMMKVAVNRKKEEEGEMRNVEERTTRRQGKLKEQEQEEDRSDPRSQPCVDATGLRLSRVLQTYALPQPHTLGHITRRDLYSRLTSPCEGRICSVRIRHSCIRARFDCMSLFPSFSYLLSYPRPSFEPGSFVRSCFCCDLHPALSTLPSSPRLHEAPIRRL